MNGLNDSDLSVAPSWSINADGISGMLSALARHRSEFLAHCAR